MTDGKDLLASPEVRRDVQAAIGARMELGPAMEEHVIDVFLERIDARIQQRVDERLSRGGPSLSGTESRSRAEARFPSIVLPSFALSIPLIAVSGIIAGGWAIAAVMACVAFVNFLYFAYDILIPNN